MVKTKNRRKKSMGGLLLTFTTIVLAIFALISALKSTGLLFGDRDKSKSTMPTTLTSPAASITPVVSATATKEKDTTPGVTTPEIIRNPGQLNISELEKLDNKTLAWWIKLNGEYRTPETTPEIMDILKNHEGYYVVDTSVKKVYLTFDEGYENGYTGKILDTLKENNVRALFFITSGYLKNSAELVRRMVEEGHEVGNHSVNHKSMPSITDMTVFESEIENLTNSFKNLFDKDMLYFRPPMGEYSVRSLEATSQLGYKSVFWSFAYEDWNVDKQKGADNAYNVCMKNIHNGAIYLLHAVSKDNADALDRIIKGIRAQGYEIGDPLDIGR